MWLAPPGAPGRAACPCSITFRRVMGAASCRVTVPGGQPQLERMTSSVGSSSTVGPERRGGDQLEQPVAGALADFPHRLVHGGERDVGEAGREDVVEADHGHVPGDIDAAGGERPHHADGHLVVGADDGVGEQRAVRAGVGQQPHRRLLAAVHGEPAAVGADQLGARVRVDDRLQGQPPRLGVGCRLRAVHVEQAAPAVVLDQVPHQRVGPGEVVRRHHVHAALGRVAGDQHHREPLGQLGHERRGQAALADEQAVHLARQRQQPGRHPAVLRQPVLRQHGAVVGLLAQESDQQRPGQPGHPRLDAAHHLVVERQAHRLDVVLVRPQAGVLHADQADHVLAAAGQGLRGAVGHVAELLDRRAHPVAGGRAHRLLPVQDPGDGGDRHPRPASDVIERNHSVTCPKCKRLQRAM